MCLKFVIKKNTFVRLVNDYFYTEKYSKHFIFSNLSISSFVKLEKYLGSTYTLRWTRRRSRRWLARSARATARLKSLWVSSPHPKNSWRKNWMPGSKVNEELSWSEMIPLKMIAYWLEKGFDFLLGDMIFYHFEDGLRSQNTQIHVCRIIPQEYFSYWIRIMF